MVVVDETKNQDDGHDNDTTDNTEGDIGTSDAVSADTDVSVQLLNGQENDEEEVESDLLIEESESPDGGWGWFIILGCFVIRMICGGIGRSNGLFFKRFIERFHQSATATAWVTALTNTIRLGTGPFVSILCNKFTSRSLVLIGATTLCVSLMITAFAPNQPFLYFSYGVLGGLGRSFALTPCPLLLGYYFEKRRSLAFGLAAAGFSLGGFAITPLVELMFQNYGFSGTFIILSGFATNAFVCACLFRPIEFQRRLMRKRKRPACEVPLNSLHSITEDSATKTTSNMSNNFQEKDKIQSDSAIQATDSRTESTINEVQNGALKRRSSKNVNSNTKDTKKKKLISLSILKDIRFVTFLFSTFFNSLPSPNLFLPSLAVSRGLTIFEAAYAISINAGADTVFRVIAGLVLDFKVFRNRRPIVYNAMIFMQAITVFLIPSMRTFVSLAVIVSVEGAAQGIKNAQRSVVMVDLLGLDKLASSMAVSMAVQAVGILLGPTISGLLKDIYGSYDGAFYFGGSAILAGGFIMAGGNIRKMYVDRQERNKKNKTTACEFEKDKE